MRSVLARVCIITCCMLLLALVGAFSTSSDGSRARFDKQVPGRGNSPRRSALKTAPSVLSYRSPGQMHKLTIAKGDREIEARLLSSGSARRVSDFDSYTLLEVSDRTLASLDAATLERVQLRDDMNLVLLKRGQIDTTGPAPRVSEELRQADSLPIALNLVQLAGPPTPDSIRELKATGARLVAYVPNNTYLVWATPAQMSRVREIGSDSRIVQWNGPFHPAYKLDPRIKVDSVEQIPVAIELLATPQSSETVRQIEARAHKVLMPQFRSVNTIHIRLVIESYLLSGLAMLPDIVSIEPWNQIKLNDERANQIVANAISEEIINSVRVSRPATPGFFSFLNSNGFNSDFDFAVDVGDSGFDRGSTLPGLSHPDFHDGAGSTRLAYMHDFSSDFAFHADNPSINPAHDTLGHGTLNASLVAGFNDSAGSGFRDGLGFQYGMGVAPFVRIGITKLFNDQGNFGQGFSYNDSVSAAYRGGARISTNSWGVCTTDSGFCNLYNADCRVFDGLVRDADVGTPGNQGMVLIFSSGNDGTVLAGGSVGMPGTAKNVITVGATEGFRAADSDGNPLTDGCGAGPTLADNAQDIPDFSSFGRVQDGRSKPDLLAPGTHITGAATQDPEFALRAETDIAVCDRYFPANQTMYTWSTGTSHAAPIVAGGAALAFQWLRNRLGADPSPALVKALLLNSTTYVTGSNGNDSLPGIHQGWGLLNLGRMFESTGRILHDEAPARTFTQSGEAPFEVAGTIPDPSREFRVMLTWTDAPGVSFSNASYVNQLNLEVVVGGVVYSGNHFSGQYSTPGGAKDFLNNAQGVRLPAGTTGPFVVRVRPTVISGDGVPGNGSDLDQDFALVVTNAREEAVPVLVVEESDGVSLGASVAHTGGAVDSSLLPNESALISINVNNQSSVASANIIGATLSIPGGPSASSSYPVIPARGSETTATPFELRVPAELRCGSTAELQLRLLTTLGTYTMPVRLRVGREASQSALLDDDVDGGRVKWKKKKGFSVANGVATSGNSSFHAVDPGRDDGDDAELSLLFMKKQVSIPADAGQVRLSFFHIFNFEPGFDGGVLEISTDGGLTWQDVGTRAIIGGYDGSVPAASNNPLGNRLAWTSRGKPGVFSQVVINLDEFAGQSVKLRFQAGFDEATGVQHGYAGWFIDDIRITTKRFVCR